MSTEVATPQQRDISSSRPPITALIIAILATQFTSGWPRVVSISWHYPIIIVSIVFALVLQFASRLPLIQSPIALALIRGQRLFVLAVSVVVVGVRLVFPIESYALASNNLINTRLRVIVTVLCPLLSLFAVFFGILSRTARTSPVFWLTLALTLILTASTAIPLNDLQFYIRVHVTGGVISS